LAAIPTRRGRTTSPGRNFTPGPEQGAREGALEFHIVGGLHPDLPFEYFLEMIRGLKQRCPGVHLKAFTMVEVGYFAAHCEAIDQRNTAQIERSGC